MFYDGCDEVHEMLSMTLSGIHFSGGLEGT
jgi:hypothetical protein